MGAAGHNARTEAVGSNSENRQDIQLKYPKEYIGN
jgi:hypothetical protein